ncbi:MAG: GHKL domain-containing protein [Elusimicrobia bacterium]|nr:GHKL domain-containing protein [Elusimicrobiota bacterium]
MNEPDLLSCVLPTVNSSLNIKDVLEKICDIVTDVFGFRAVWVGLAGEGRGKSIIKSVMQKGFNRGSSASFPLVYQKETIGSINICAGSKNAFTPARIELMKKFSCLAAVAVKNAKLFEETLKTKEQLFQSERMATVGYLTSELVHELSNPLTTILGYAQLIQQQKFSGPSKEDIDKIVSEAKRAKEIALDLLNFARKGLMPELKKGNINSIVNQVLNIKNYDINQNNVRVKKELYGKLPDVMLDSRQIMQVLLNLLDNSIYAILAKKSAGEIRIKTEVITRGQRETSRIEFSDNGIGIPKESINKIFMPFFTTKPAGQGTGLGLAISRRIIEQHGGQMVVSSKPNKYTTFYINLPAQPGL